MHDVNNSDGTVIRSKLKTDYSYSSGLCDFLYFPTTPIFNNDKNTITVSRQDIDTGATMTLGINIIGYK